jgi:hypothetical protein
VDTAAWDVVGQARSPADQTSFQHMELQDNSLQGGGGGDVRFDRPGQPSVEDGCPDSLCAREIDKGGDGARMRSFSLDPHRHPTLENGGGVVGGGESVWHGEAEEEERAWRRDSYHSQPQQAGPSSWHGDNMRPPPQPWDSAANGTVWRREAGGGRYEQGVFRSGEAMGWQPPAAKEPESHEMDQGWRLPNIPRRGQDAGWRHNEFIVS